MKIINTIVNKFFDAVEAVDEEIKQCKENEEVRMKWFFGVFAIICIVCSVAILESNQHGFAESKTMLEKENARLKAELSSSNEYIARVFLTGK